MKVCKRRNTQINLRKNKIYIAGVKYNSISLLFSFLDLLKLHLDLFVGQANFFTEKLIGLLIEMIKCLLIWEKFDTKVWRSTSASMLRPRTQEVFSVLSITIASVRLCVLFIITFGSMNEKKRKTSQTKNSNFNELNSVN